MIAYQFFADGYYAGQIEDGGILPSSSTYVKPDIKNGFIPRWTGSAWEQVEDHKGEQGYLEGQPHTIRDYGPYPAGWSKEPPEPTEPTEEEKLEQAKTAKLAEIATGYDAALAATLTMPKAEPTAQEVAIGAALFAVEDAEGLEYVNQAYAAARDDFRKMVDAAGSVEEVAAVEVRFAV